MAEQETQKRERVVVSIYSEEYNTVKARLGIAEKEELTSKGVRVMLGLKESGKTTGLNTQIRAGLKEKLPQMSDEDKKALLEKLGYKDGKIVEKVGNNAAKKK